MDRQQLVLLLIPFGFLFLHLLEQEEQKPNTSTELVSAMGRTYPGQTDESYCLECIEGHTMSASTETRHAIDRYRTANGMTPGVTEKVRVAIAELQGIAEDANNLDRASPEVKKGVNEILNEVRWIRKEYGVSGKGLTIGHGTEEDLNALKNRIKLIQNKAYLLVDNCPTCKIVIA